MWQFVSVTISCRNIAGRIMECSIAVRSDTGTLENINDRHVLAPETMQRPANGTARLYKPCCETAEAGAVTAGLHVARD